jgi:cupin 2 domain-containing protein
MSIVIRNLWEGNDGPTDHEKIQSLFETEAVRIERIVSHGQASPKGFWYDQPDDEWVVLLKGEATLAFAEEDSVQLKAGDYLFIPANVRHRVEHTSDDALWLAAHLRGRPHP